MAEGGESSLAPALVRSAVTQSRRSPIPSRLQPSQMSIVFVHCMHIRVSLLLRAGRDQPMLQLKVRVHVVPDEREAAIPEVVLNLALGDLAVGISKVAAVLSRVGGARLAAAPGTGLDVGLLERLAEDLVHRGSEGIGTLDRSGGDEAEAHVQGLGQADPLLGEGGLDAAGSGEGGMGHTAGAGGFRVGQKRLHGCSVGRGGGGEVGLGKEFGADFLFLGS